MFALCTNMLILRDCLTTHSFFAVSPMDYLALAEVLIFDACETQQCVVVTIVDDVVDEPEEVFRVALERTIDLDSRIILEPIDGEIIIADNDGNTANYLSTLIKLHAG